MIRYVLVIFLFFFIQTKSQQIEIGLNVGYNFSNIADSNSNEERVVIGDALWNSNYGFNILYYFKNPNTKVSARLNGIFRISKKGSESEVNSNYKYEFTSSTIGLTGGIGGNVGDGFILFLDAGFGYSILDNNNIYTGNSPQNKYFTKIKDDLIIKNNEFVFLYALGVEKELGKSFKLIFEVNGDASITQLNNSSGNYRTQGLGFGLGFRYLIKFNNEK